MSEEKRPEWMSEISSLVNPEDYLLGRKIDKTFELSQQEKAKKAKEARIELIASNKVKLADDPILELERRREQLKMDIVSNPIKLRQLRELLLKEDAQKEEGNSLKTSNQRNSTSKLSTSEKAPASGNRSPDKAVRRIDSHDKSHKSHSKRRHRSPSTSSSSSSSSSPSSSTSSSSSSTSSQSRQRRRRRHRDHHKHSDMRSSSNRYHSVDDRRRDNRSYRKGGSRRYHEDRERRDHHRSDRTRDCSIPSRDQKVRHSRKERSSSHSPRRHNKSSRH